MSGIKMLGMGVVLGLACVVTTGCESTGREPGGVAIASAKATAQVTAVDYAKRTVTLKGESGKERTYKVGPEAVNFNQVKVGDTVNAIVMEELAVHIAKPGELTGDISVKDVTLAPVGAKPGIVVTDTVQKTVKVVSINHWTRKVKLLDSDGKTHEVGVAKDVDLNKVSKGDTVVVRYTEAMALTVESAK